MQQDPRQLWPQQGRQPKSGGRAGLRQGCGSSKLEPCHARQRMISTGLRTQPLPVYVMDAHLINGLFGQLEKLLDLARETTEIGNHVKNKAEGSVKSWHCEMNVINSKPGRPECHKHQGQVLPCLGNGKVPGGASREQQSGQWSYSLGSGPTASAAAPQPQQQPRSLSSGPTASAVTP